LAFFDSIAWPFRDRDPGATRRYEAVPDHRIWVMSPLANLAQINVARFLINCDAANLLVVSTAFALAEAHAGTLLCAGRQRGST
jgi:hypothetical protein